MYVYLFTYSMWVWNSMQLILDCKFHSMSGATLDVWCYFNFSNVSFWYRKYRTAWHYFLFIFVDKLVSCVLSVIYRLLTYRLKMAAKFLECCQNVRTVSPLRKKQICFQRFWSVPTSSSSLSLLSSSFDPASVYCFLTVFNPFIMGGLMMWKVLHFNTFSF